jgi:hypothetical protein
MDKQDKQLKAEIAAAVKEERTRMARMGGYARAKAMSPEERRRSALKAAEAAAKVHKRKAKERKAKKKA